MPLHLIQTSRVALDSRAQARRLVQGLEAFRRVEIDFGAVAEIGHGFADELFRVQAGLLPQVELLPVNTSNRVAAMLHSVRAIT